MAIATLWRYQGVLGLLEGKVYDATNKLKGLFKHHLLSTHYLLDETKTFWFGTRSMYYEFDKLEIEAKLGLFIKPRLFANGQELEKIKIET